MICPRCTQTVSTKCRYCPQCGEVLTPREGAEITLETAVEELTSPQPSLSLPQSEPEPVVSAAEIHRLLTRANLNRMRREWPGAVEGCIQVLRLDPGNQTAHSLLGDIYRDQGKMEDAVRWYRMAVDLKPNAADESKLREAEREQARRIAAGDGAARRVSMALDPGTGQMPIGTTELMGYTPRQWLKGITVGSLSFLAVMLIGMIWVQTTRRTETELPRPMPAALPRAGSLSEARRTGGLLPGAQPGKPSLATANSSSSSRQAPTGSGFPPDLPGSSRPTPRRLTQPKSAEAKRSGGEAGLPPAPIIAVEPIPGREQAGAAPSPRAGEAPSGAGRLTGGMRVGEIQSSRSGTTALILLAPGGTSVPALRADVVRNVYRSASQIFSRDATVRRVAVYVQQEKGSAGGELLFSAQLDRETAGTHDAEHDPIDVLEGRLSAVQWNIVTGSAESQSLKPALLPSSGTEI